MQCQSYLDTLITGGWLSCSHSGAKHTQPQASKTLAGVSPTCQSSAQAGTGRHAASGILARPISASVIPPKPAD